jgi:hypothetical protein
MNAVYVIDKLNLGFIHNEDPRKLPIFLKYNIQNLSTSLIKPSESHQCSYTLFYKNIYIGILNCGLRYNNNLHHILIYNQVFYSYNGILDDFIKCIHKLDLELTVSKLEVSLDVDSKIIINKTNRLFSSNKINLKKNYVRNRFLTDYDEGRIKNPPTTYYFESKGKNKKQKNYLRFENKTAELAQPKNKIKREYITRFHSNNGLDTSKTIYRLELVIPCKESLEYATKSIYRSKDQSVSGSFTNHQYQQKIKKIKKLEAENAEQLFFDSRYNKLVNEINEYSKKVHVKSCYDIDVNRLTSSDYLKVIFSTFSKKIFLNVDDVLPPTLFTVKKVKTKDIEMIKRPKIIKNTVPSYFYTVDYIMQKLGISESEAEEALEKMIKNYEIDKFENDLFTENLYLEKSLLYKNFKL